MELFTTKENRFVTLFQESKSFDVRYQIRSFLRPVGQTMWTTFYELTNELRCSTSKQEIVRRYFSISVYDTVAFPNYCFGYQQNRIYATKKIALLAVKIDQEAGMTRAGNWLKDVLTGGDWCFGYTPMKNRRNVIDSHWKNTSQWTASSGFFKQDTKLKYEPKSKIKTKQPKL